MRLPGCLSACLPYALAASLRKVLLIYNIKGKHITLLPREIGNKLLLLLLSEGCQISLRLQ